MDQNNDHLLPLADDLKAMEDLRKKVLARMDSAEKRGDQREVSVCNINVIEIDAQIEQIKLLAVSMPSHRPPQPQRDSCPTTELPSGLRKASS